MQRKRLTQRFPWLLPLRKWQRKQFFYMRMGFDQHQYAKQLQGSALPHEVFATSSRMINRNSGFELQYQINKAHNLKLAAKTLHNLVIRPGETFSFWQLVRYADRDTPYKDGLNFTDGKITGAYGGGLCQMSNVLYWMFLHTPLTVVERHGHTAEMLPPVSEELPVGIDATIQEGWLDLKVKNETKKTFQLHISFDEEFMYGRILSDGLPTDKYEIFNGTVTHYRENGKTFRYASVDCYKTSSKTGKREQLPLYGSTCEIGYPLPESIEVGRRAK